VWHLIPEGACRRALIVVEGYVDGAASEAALIDAYEAAGREILSLRLASNGPVQAAQAARAASRDFRGNTWAATWESPRNAAEAAAKTTDWRVERSAQALLLLDIFGNPFRTNVLDNRLLHWNDAAVVKIAQSIYDARRFADLPILADALEDAGCADAAILEHCRSGGEHVRGCWVVDLLLGKS
jgi:hypothetical protein